MVAGRPDRAEGHLAGAGIELANRFEPGPGGQQGGGVGGGPHHRVAIEVATAGQAELGQALEEGLGVDASHLGPRGRAGLERDQRLVEAGGDDPGLEGDQALRSLGVAWPGVVVGELGVGGEEHGHPGTLPPVSAATQLRSRAHACP